MQLTLHLKFTVLLALLFGPEPLQTGTAPAETEIAGRVVSMELIKAKDFTPTSWPGETVTLTTGDVVTKPGDRIFDLLTANGIRPDNEAYTLIYDLNSSIEKLDPLAPGITMTLPRVVGRGQFQRLISNGHVVVLTVDSKVKSQLHDDTGAIKALSTRFERLDRSRLAEPNKRQETINFVRDLSDWFELIDTTISQRTAKPLRRVTLLQIANEAHVLRSILERALTPNLKLDAQDQAQIMTIHKDLDEVIKFWDQTMRGELPPAEPQFNVVVDIKGKDTNKIRGLRVYYVVFGLFRDPPKNPPVRSAGFNGLGSGSSATLPIKDYKVWAAKDGEPEHPVTPITPLSVRKPLSGNTIKLELSLK